MSLTWELGDGELQRLTCDVIGGMFEILKRSQSRHEVRFIDTCFHTKFKLNSHLIIYVVLNKCLLLCNLSYSSHQNTFMHTLLLHAIIA